MRWESSDNPHGMVELLRDCDAAEVHVRDSDGNEWIGDVENVQYTEIDPDHYDAGSLSVSFLSDRVEVDGEAPWHSAMTPSISCQRDGDDWGDVEVLYPQEQKYEAGAADAKSVAVEWVAVDETHNVFDVLAVGDPVRVTSTRTSSEIVAGVVGEEERGRLSVERPVDLYFPPAEWDADSGVLRGVYRDGGWGTSLRADGESSVPVSELKFGFECENIVEEAREALSGMNRKSSERLVWTDAVLRYHIRREGSVLTDAISSFEGDWREASLWRVLRREDVERILEEDAWAVVRDRDVFEWMPPSTRTASDYLDVIEYFRSDVDG